MAPLEAASADLLFRHTVLLLPMATVLHVLEEWPRFPRWARLFASPRYSDREYVITHVFAVAFAFGSAVLLWALPAGWLVFLFFAFVFGPGVFCNALFHAAAAAWTRTYCPGVVTGLLVYLPLSILLAVLVVREALITPSTLLLALLVAVAFHTLEVGHNVFKRW